MKSANIPRLLFVILLLSLALILFSHALAQSETPPAADIVAGAELYDRWYAYLGVNPPSGDMPIWSRQTTNSRSGAETWRCVECHGWDYKGVEGAYASGSHLTGFPNVMKLAAGLSLEDIVSHLHGSKDPAHDFSKYMDDTSLRRLAEFLKAGTIDDSQYIDPISLQPRNANIEHGRQLFTGICTTCHGDDGRKIVFRSEGIDESLGSIANRDPWRFLHRTRFGVAGTKMPIGSNLGWSPEDGRDILAYVQTLPSGFEIQVNTPQVAKTVTPVASLGGPAHDLWTGILTGLGAFAGAASYSILFIAGFVLVGVLVVTLLKKRK